MKVDAKKFLFLVVSSSRQDIFRSYKSFKNLITSIWIGKLKGHFHDNTFFPEVKSQVILNTSRIFWVLIPPGCDVVNCEVFLDTRSEGSMKYPSSVCLFVFLSIFPELLSGTGHRNFPSFCMKLRCHLTNKWQSDFLKNLVLGFWSKKAQQGPKRGFQVYWKSHTYLEFFWYFT